MALADEFLEALVQRDGWRATALARTAVDEGVPIGEVYLDVIQPALYEIGHRWALGELGVADEHAATAVCEALLGELRTRMRMPPRDGRLAVVTGTPGERHGLGARMVADFLESDGWEVLLLGPDMPARELAALVAAECPDVVALSTATAGALPGIAEVLEALGRLDPRPCLVVGGQFWTPSMAGVAEELGADLVAGDPRELVARLAERFPPLPAGVDDRAG